MQIATHFIEKIPALVYTPDKGVGGTKVPGVIFLHGVNESGDGTPAGLNKLKNSGNHGGILRFGDQLGFIVVAPQFVPALNGYVPEWTGGTYVDKVIEWAKANLPIDPSMIYLTGLSGGGGGTWNYFTKELAYAQKIAAAIPVCGLEQVRGDFSLPAKASLPIWAFHAADDGTVNVGSSRRQIENVNKFNPVPLAKYTEYPTGGHAIWGKVYGDPALYTWMLAQKRKLTNDPEPEPDPLTVKRIDFTGKRVQLSDNKYRNLDILDYDLQEKAYQLKTVLSEGALEFTVPL